MVCPSFKKIIWFSSFDILAEAFWVVLEKAFNWNLSTVFTPKRKNPRDSVPLNHLRYSNLIAMKARDFFSETPRRTFDTRGLFCSYCSRREKQCHQHLGNSVDAGILFLLKSFCGLHFQLKIRTDQSVLAYTSMPLKSVVMGLYSDGWR